NTLLIAKQMMRQAAEAGHTRLSEEQTGFIRSAYAGAISAGRQANAGQPGAKAAKLVERFACDAADVLRFTTDTAVWFSNNQSERDLRPTKLQLKISGTWRTLQGLADFAPYGPTCPPPPNTAWTSSTCSSRYSLPVRGFHPTRPPSQAEHVRTTVFELPGTSFVSYCVSAAYSSAPQLFDTASANSLTAARPARHM